MGKHDLNMIKIHQISIAVKVTLVNINLAQAIA